jgi:DNA-binding CsgD family transcriptional regulator
MTTKARQPGSMRAGEPLPALDDRALGVAEKLIELFEHETRRSVTTGFLTAIIIVARNEGLSITVAAGEQWLPLDLVDATLARDSQPRSARQRMFDSLTKRQQQIVMMVSNGLSNKGVGRRLDLSEGTVKVHLHNIFRKLGVNNRTALTAMAVTCRETLERSVYASYQEPHPSRQSPVDWSSFRRAA